MFYHDKLDLILERQEKIMADLTALNAAVAQLQTDASNIEGALTNANAGNVPQDQIDAVTSAVTSVSTGLQAAVAPPAPEAPQA